MVGRAIYGAILVTRLQCLPPGNGAPAKWRLAVQSHRQLPLAVPCSLGTGPPSFAGAHGMQSSLSLSSRRLNLHQTQLSRYAWQLFSDEAQIVTKFVAAFLFLTVLTFLRATESEASEWRVAPRSKLDPGRITLHDEWLREGTTVFNRPLPMGGGRLVVTSHSATAYEGLPPWASDGTKQEWRVLKFVPVVGSNDLVQSVTKVCVEPDKDRATMRADCLTLVYTKTCVSVVLGALAVVDEHNRSLLKSLASGKKGPGFRFLCIGLGGGSVPYFLVSNLPAAVVRVAELEPTVVEAAYEALGLPNHPRIEVVAMDGAKLATDLAAAIAKGEEEPFDALLIDAYDAAGGVPEPLWTRNGPIAKALAAGLLKPSGVVAANFLGQVAEQVPDRMAAYKEALAERGATQCFAVRTRTTRNLLGVQLCGGPGAAIGDLRQEIRFAAQEVGEIIGAPFDMDGFAEDPEDLDIYAL